MRTVSRQTPPPKVRLRGVNDGPQGCRLGREARWVGRVVSVGTEGEGEGLRAPSSPSLTRPHPAGRVASFSMPSSSSRYALGPSLLRGHEVGERVQSNEMGTSVLIMQPILRFLQLLCENHNRDLQVRPRPYAPTPRPTRAPPRPAPRPSPRPAHFTLRPTPPRAPPLTSPTPAPSPRPAHFTPRPTSRNLPLLCAAPRQPGHHGMWLRGRRGPHPCRPHDHGSQAGPPSMLKRCHSHPSPYSAELPALPEQ